MQKYSEKIYSTDLFDLYLTQKSLLVELKKDNNLLISSWHNGGYHENMKYIINQTVETDDYRVLGEIPFDEFQRQTFKNMNINPDITTGLITSACMDNHAIKTMEYEDLKVTSIITAGADKNGTKAGDPASFYEHDNTYKTVGTINIIILIDANLEAGTLVNATITATEAKTSILQDLKVESQYSTHIATGTGTDGICIISNKESSNHLENAGKHSKLGELIAKSVRDAAKKALYLQTCMTEEYQKTVLSRLSRFNIDFDKLYENTHDITRQDYAAKLYKFNKNPENIAWISMILDLIDEVQNNLLNMEDITDIIKLTTQNYLNTKVEIKITDTCDVLEYIIKTINQKITE